MIRGEGKVRPGGTANSRLIAGKGDQKRHIARFVGKEPAWQSKAGCEISQLPMFSHGMDIA
jgi:hypothetical protein